MKDRRVIYDSEEDDDGFSPLSSPARGDTSHVAATAEDDNEGHRVENHTGDSRSTDPDYFKQIYEEQQKAVTASVSDPLRDTQAQNGSSDKLKSSDSKTKNNSSSITDPTLRSAKKRALGKIGVTDLGNLTQVTTPSAPSAKQKDVYDFSLSDEEGALSGPVILHTASKGARTTSKRKRGQPDGPNLSPVISSPPQLSTSKQCAQDQEDESPRPTRKKRKSAPDQSLRLVVDDIDLLVTPTTENMSEPPDETHVDHEGLDSAVPDTRVAQVISHDRPPASFFIDPPDITSSQKQEYLRMSGGSDLDREDNHQQALLPVPKPAQTQDQRPTSTSVSTIAYTTPSRYASSVAPLPILETSDRRSSNVATSSGRKTQLEKAPPPHSSPDELNSISTARKSRGKRHMSAVDEEDELAQHDSWNSDEIGYSRETYVPRPNRCRSGAGQDSLVDTQAEANTRTASKNRQKKGANAETTHEDSWDSNKIGVHREHYAPRSSRKRSRGRVEDDGETQHPEEMMPDTCPPGIASHEETLDVEPTAISPSHQASYEVTEAIAGADPEVWAALPEDIRQELQQQSARTSQASRTRRNGRAGESTSSLGHIQEEAPQPGKRGRKKKVQMMDKAPIALDKPVTASEETGARPSPAPATTKRKRGRPRKAEAAPPSPSAEIEESALAMDAPKLLLLADEKPSAAHALPEEPSRDVEMPKASARRGRKKKVVEAPPVHLNELKDSADEDEEGNDPVRSMSKLPVEPSHTLVDTPAVSVEIEDRQALRDISSTASNSVFTNTDEAGQQQEVTPEPKAKDVQKSASTPGQQSKVPLRVGLSKKSRIAPLLKIIRK